MITTNQRSVLLFSIPFVLLSIPLIAMQFTKEVNWTLSDFVIMGILLFATVFTLDFVLKKVKTFKSRLILVLGIVALLMLIWAEMAVGIFGSPIAGN
ncbi:hypothetical protein [Epilithonimonas xixisoli]|uniref:Uncharacterized protein n=1 Tax=Epilithonimonas xixisoli TaxID=1476462 RepID=A0A4R8ICI6_9FLAO|nr:hypothetical protein [Epilithonimonas xixisoli]TDX82779.1 hypothetical protein B0I22_2807 [Epilithonimonas xixisoli]